MNDLVAALVEEFHGWDEVAIRCDKYCEVECASPREPDHFGSDESVYTLLLGAAHSLIAFGTMLDGRMAGGTPWGFLRLSLPALYLHPREPVEDGRRPPMKLAIAVRLGIIRGVDEDAFVSVRAKASRGRSPGGEPFANNLPIDLEAVRWVSAACPLIQAQLKVPIVDEHSDAW